jgi:hypothetical protein
MVRNLVYYSFTILPAQCVSAPRLRILHKCVRRASRDAGLALAVPDHQMLIIRQRFLNANRRY